MIDYDDFKGKVKLDTTLQEFYINKADLPSNASEDDLHQVYYEYLTRYLIVMSDNLEDFVEWAQDRLDERMQERYAEIFLMWEED